VGLLGSGANGLVIAGSRFEDEATGLERATSLEVELWEILEASGGLFSTTSEAFGSTLLVDAGGVVGLCSNSI
jgi:hypothetical protein